MPWPPGVFHLSLREGTLSNMNRNGLLPQAGITLDTQVKAYVLDGKNKLYDLTQSDQLQAYTGNGFGPSWAPVSPPGYVVSDVIAPHAGNPCAASGVPTGIFGDGLYMIASNNGAPAQVWQYGGSGMNWTPLTGTNTILYDHALAGITTAQCVNGVPSATPNLYIMARNPPGSPLIWKWTGTGTNWTPITGWNTKVASMVAANNNLYMQASTGGNEQVFQYGGVGSEWTPITSRAASVAGMWVAGANLFVEMNVGWGVNQIWEYVPPAPGVAAGAANWILLTGTNTALLPNSPLLVQDGIELFQVGNNGGGNQVFEFEGIAALSTWTTSGWLPLTQTATYQVSGPVTTTTADVLQMSASQNGGPVQPFDYQGTPNSWTPAP
jgi:hypothetical protein